ncbi:MAG: hypothetical protein CVV24_13300 [Ignavibacteriae bacterium HGW-Ignavibacteriae-3]|nr:MAG: hypothetical protein CVV24_13300 [Ignavibacteriae bacterium HGW-Ignavibacteriae-3]
MKLFKYRIILNSFLLIVFISLLASAQEKKKLSVEWRYSPEAASITQLPNVQWLDNGKAVIYDSRKPADQRTFELMDPAAGSTKPALDMKKALESLKNIMSEKTPPVLPPTSNFDKQGEKVFYLLGGDIYLLNLKDASFQRLTETKEEEKNVNFSPDGNFLAYVRSNNIYFYDIKNKIERALTNDGSDSLLNGTLSWVYWEEVFGRKDLAYWWSDNSKSIAYLQTDESQVSVMYYPDFKPAVPDVIKQRYPKTGGVNPVVKVGVAGIEDAKTTWIDFSGNPYEYNKG